MSRPNVKSVAIIGAGAAGTYKSLHGHASTSPDTLQVRLRLQHSTQKMHSMSSKSLSAGKHLEGRGS
jgi:hypothetical protein